MDYLERARAVLIGIAEDESETTEERIAAAGSIMADESPGESDRPEHPPCQSCGSMDMVFRSPIDTDMRCRACGTISIWTKPAWEQAIAEQGELEKPAP